MRTLKFAMYTSLVILMIGFTSCDTKGKKDQPKITDKEAVEQKEKTPEELANEALRKQIERMRQDSIAQAEDRAREKELLERRNKATQDSLTIIANNKEIAYQKALAEQKEKERKLKEEKRKQEAAEKERKRKEYMIKSTRKIRLTLKRMVCEMSDDEGPSNDADMDRFRFTVNASQNKCKNGKSKSISGRSPVLYNYNGAPRTTGKGYIWNVNKSMDLIFNEADCDLKNLTVKIEGYAREQDNGSSSEDEIGTATLNLKGKDINKDHIMTLSSSDFRYKVELSFQKINW